MSRGCQDFGPARPRVSALATELHPLGTPWALQKRGEMMSKITATYTTDRVILAYALRLLRAGRLASNIPGELMREFGITPARAGRLAGEAVKRWKAER